MEKEIISELNKILEKDFSEEYPFFKDPRYKPCKIDKNNFKVIKDVKTNKKICFIDGGNAEIIAAPNLSLNFIRVYSVVYQNNKRIKHLKFEFYLLVSSIKKNDSIEFKTRIFGNSLRLDNFSFNVEDETLKIGIQKAEINSVAGVIRKFAELQLMLLMTDELGEGDAIVRDGSLQCIYNHENGFFSKIYDKAIKKQINVMGLCKTSRLLTNNGNTISYVLSRICPESEWYYHPIAEINNQEHRADIFFVKLHKKSRYIYRLDIFKDVNYNIEEILTLLKLNSSDPVFLGYPYGMIEADSFSRIANNEKEYLKIKLLGKLNNNNKMEDLMNSLNAHDVLDNLSW